MERDEIFQSLADAIIEGDPVKATETAQSAVESGVDPLDAVEKGMAKGMEVVGERFECGDAYLPELMMAGDAFKAAMEILKPELLRQKKATKEVGTVLLASVKGDLHSIGKNILANVLETHGFTVIDAGVDNGALQIIEEAQKSNAQAIGLSALMTTTMPAQREVIEALKELGLREQYRVIVGGGPVTQDWADEIGADGYGQNAVQAVELLKQLVA